MKTINILHKDGHRWVLRGITNTNINDKLIDDIILGVGDSVIHLENKNNENISIPSLILKNSITFISEEY
jgi:hypothetical protein